MIPTLTDIPPDVLLATRALIRAQAAVPESPLRRTPNGDVELCAAAALAVVATKPGEERDRLVARLEQHGRDYIMEAFENLGWSRELGKQMLVANDSFSAATRKEQVLDLLTTH